MALDLMLGSPVGPDSVADRRIGAGPAAIAVAHPPVVDRPDRRKALTLFGLGEVAARYATDPDLADKIRAAFTRPKATLRELFARIVFNACVGNIDDRTRNHAASWDGHQLALAIPTPSPYFHTHQTIDAVFTWLTLAEVLLAACYASRVAMQRRTAVPVLVLLGGLAAALLEPMASTIGLVALELVGARETEAVAQPRTLRPGRSREIDGS